MNRLATALIALVMAGNVSLWAQKSPFARDATLPEQQYKAVVGDYLNNKWLGAPSWGGDRITALQNTVKGTFWRNPEWVKAMGLSADQQKKMDDVFQQYRLRLIDLTATLEKEELILEPLFGTTPPTPENATKILTQIDRIAEARAELEKANSKMFVGILQILTADQWAKLPTAQAPVNWKVRK